MSDLSIYELEDIIWDDFDRSGDHIVPHPNKDDGGEDKSEDAICKKPRRDVTAPLQIKEESNPETLNKETQMMEKDSWGVFAASGDADSAKDMSTIQSGDAKISSNITSGSELCTDDGILKDNSAAVGDNNSYNYPPSHNKLTTLQPDLNLFSNDGDDKESSDLLYYGWPDIGNFDDMDRMLSNCDSSFGLGVTGNDDELVWFTSEDPAGGYEEPMKMELKFPCTETNTPPQNNGSQESDNKRSRIVSESKDEFKPKDNKGYMQNTTYLHDPSGPMMSCTKFENKGPTCSSQKETSNESMVSYGDPLFQGTGSENYGGFEPSFGGNGKQMDMMMIQASGSDLIPSQKKIESQNDIRELKKGSSVGLGSLDVPEGSSISTELDEISLEATSFRQLQQVMEQLDLRTKLCIRDSLYRLARSAEQRHNNHAGISGPLLTDGTNNGFMDMETDTNPIDRTIAHLLFHRPSESFNMPTTSPLKPNAKERRNESDDKVSSSRKN
ncbi:protein LNK1 [Lactuca sativa]|uniref:Protein LNK1 n=1 Tax=Lactuca sativa TaxID=4236 RepID=A0A9R1WMP0_LACSA|nr:protein LNK1 [Lactuca sativa]XP_023750672.1 protein LNK1 [Lactuca sativa]KAJ0185410.1 hypothetical protein LSAT_V11C900502960 [Lactuca sativa]